MANNAVRIDVAGGAVPAPRVGARPCPPHIAALRDELFQDADRHGPRLPALLRRSIPAGFAVGAAVLAAASPAWRELLIAVVPHGAMDLVLVAPVLAALVVFAAALAPLARIRVEPLLLLGLVLLGGGTKLVLDGHVVAATVPAAIGAMLLGVAAARGMRRVVWTLPVLLAAGLSDAHSVEGGVTRQLLAGRDVGTSSAPVVPDVEPVLSIAPELVARVDLLVLHIPAAGGTWLLGLVDIVALGLLLGLSHLYWQPLGRAAVALAVALAATIGFGVPVPVLPMLGLAWVLVHPRLVWRATRFSMRRLTYLGG